MRTSTGSNQAETYTSTQENDPHLSTSDGTHLNMPGAGIKHGGSVDYSTPTRSDANKD